MASKASWTILDYSNEKTGFSVYVGDITAANLDAKLAGLTALNVATAALTVGNIVGNRISIDTGNAGAPVVPTNPLAQRELAVRFFYTDTVNGDKGSFTIGAVDANVVAQQGTDNVDLTLSLVAPVVTAFEAVCTSKQGNPISITSGKIVGRRN